MSQLGREIKVNKVNKKSLVALSELRKIDYVKYQTVWRYIKKGFIRKYVSTKGDKMKIVYYNEQEYQAIKLLKKVRTGE